MERNHLLELREGFRLKEVTTMADLKAQDVINALQKLTFTGEELWAIQVEAAAAALEDGVGSRWKVDLPWLQIEFNEDSISAGVVRRVTERTGIPMHNLTFDGLMSDGRLLYEMILAVEVIQHGKEEANVVAILDATPMGSLLDGVKMEVVAPDPKEPSGTLHPAAPWGPRSSESEETPSSE